MPWTRFDQVTQGHSHVSHPRRPSSTRQPHPFQQTHTHMAFARVGVWIITTTATPAHSRTHCTTYSTCSRGPHTRTNTPHAEHQRQRGKCTDDAYGAAIAKGLHRRDGCVCDVPMPITRTRTQHTFFATPAKSCTKRDSWSRLPQARKAIVHVPTRTARLTYARTCRGRRTGPPTRRCVHPARS